MDSKRQFEALRAISVIPEADRSNWLSGAEDSIDFLKTNAKAHAVVLFASMPCAWIASAMALNEKLDPIDRDDLSDARIELDDTWVIQRSYGGGERHRVYLQPPLSFGSKSLDGGELPLFRRKFYGVDRQEPFELNQKLLHSLSLFYVEHRSAYCRLDENGDFEDVITIQIVVGADPRERLEMVTINSKDLAQYLALSGTALVRRFDFTRVDHNTFSGWGEPERHQRGTEDLFYSLGLGSGNGSWANGYQVLRSNVTVGDLEAAFEVECAGSTEREYESFIAYDWKNRKVVETSCSPKALANYFTDSELPYELSPAFFRAEVLSRYKADPDKYRMGNRSISCRNAWFLKSYDINEAGQVHAYLGDLARLPIVEQRYWKAFNEAPKGGISSRSFKVDFQGQWDLEYDPLAELKRKVEVLNKEGLAWWSPRTSHALESTSHPATESQKEWSDEILALDQLVVEGFIENGLKRIVAVAGGTGPIQPGSLNSLSAALVARGISSEEAAEAVAPLKRLHHLRSKVKGHASSEREQIVKDVLTRFGSYRAHFAALVTDCDRALDLVMSGLGLRQAQPA